MSDEPVDMEHQDAWALADLDSAISVMSATVGAAFGPLGAILGAGVSSYAKFAIRRFLELRTRIDGAGLEEQEIIERLDENETLAQMIAEVIRGTVDPISRLSGGSSLTRRSRLYRTMPSSTRRTCSSRRRLR